jgi:acyl-CoA synthetase (AMP-forming)/AMP-acid ligase II
MLGYLNAASPFDNDGWMCTEDLVEVDGEYIRILGRSTDLINVGGQKVYPAEVESVLLQLENVSDVSVYGEKSALMGQIVVARFNLIRPEPLARLKERVRSFCRGRLATFKVPVKIEISEKAQHGARFKKLRKAESGGEDVPPVS